VITINGYKLQPTIFPDGTSQVWQLPTWLLQSMEYWVDWRYENESELLQLIQLKTLTGICPWYLYVPYLPYARQDKDIDNNASWSLHSFASVLNLLECDSVTALDAHNPFAAKKLIKNFVNKPIYDIHAKVLDQIKPDIIIFPDKGAYDRYPHLHNYPYALCRKQRDQATGRITKYEIDQTDLTKYATALVVDDLCDGGATFLMLMKELPIGLNTSLFVTHGVFSKGTADLFNAGYRIICTNSFIKSEKTWALTFEV
jgi:ribose-phosphate pyrophosphokinase